MKTVMFAEMLDNFQHLTVPVRKKLFSLMKTFKVLTGSYRTPPNIPKTP
jgi:hypothetical protein